MSGPLAVLFAQVREALPVAAFAKTPDERHEAFQEIAVVLWSIERHVQDTRENIVLALPDHGGRCGGTDEKPAALDQSDRFANPCIRCRVLLAFDAALPAREKGTE